jgi:hypothetical protein
LVSLPTLCQDQIQLSRIVFFVEQLAKLHSQFKVYRVVAGEKLGERIPEGGKHKILRSAESNSAPQIGG